MAPLEEADTGVDRPVTITPLGAYPPELLEWMANVPKMMDGTVTVSNPGMFVYHGVMRRGKVIDFARRESWREEAMRAASSLACPRVAR